MITVNPQLRYSLYVVVSAIIAAVSGVTAEIALGFYEAPPVLVVFTSNLVGGLILVSVSLRHRPTLWRGWQRTDWLKIIVVALLIYAISFIVRTTAVTYVGAGTASLLGRLETIFIVLLATLFLGETLSSRFWLAGALTLIGTLLVNLNPNGWQLTLGWGEFLAIIAPFGIAVGIIISKPLLQRLNAQWMTGLAFLFGALFLLPLLPIYSANATFSFGVLILLLCTGACRGLAWFAYNTAMPHIGASYSALIFLSSTFFTIIFQVVVANRFPFLNIRVPPNLLMALLGGLVIVAGVAILTLGPKQPAA